MIECVRFLPHSLFNFNFLSFNGPIRRVAAPGSENQLDAAAATAVATALTAVTSLTSLDVT